MANDCTVCEGEKRVPGTGGEPCPVCVPDGLTADMTDDQLRAFAARIAGHPAVADVVLTIGDEPADPMWKAARDLERLTEEPARVDFTTVYGAALYDELDPGIRDTVRFLHEHGFDTCDSGDGRHKFADPAWQIDGKLPDEVLDFPHVAIRANPDRMIADADRLAGLLQGIGIELIPFGHAGPALVASYDPADPGNAVLFLSDVELVRRER